MYDSIWVVFCNRAKATGGRRTQRISAASSGFRRSSRGAGSANEQQSKRAQGSADWLPSLARWTALLHQARRNEYQVCHERKARLATVIRSVMSVMTVIW